MIVRYRLHRVGLVLAVLAAYFVLFHYFILFHHRLGDQSDNDTSLSTSLRSSSSSAYHYHPPPSSSSFANNNNNNNAQSVLQDEQKSAATSDATRAERLPKVLYTVFAGRKNRMKLQEPYWQEMYNLGAIDEIHLWNYTQRDGFFQENLDYLRHLEVKYAFVKIMEPSDVDMTETYWFDKNNSLLHAEEHFGNGRARLEWAAERWYAEYYKYYSVVNPYNGVIIKADDDIVYVNSTMVRPFAEYVHNHKEVFLLSASIVNQGLCAYYQQLHGAIPESVTKLPFAQNGMGDLHDNAEQALMVHRYFLQNQEKFYIPEPEYYPFTYTINVNFIAIRGEEFHKTFQLIQEKLLKERRYYDEGAITWDGIRDHQYEEGIYMPLTVAHATYGAQVAKIDEVLTLYADYARNEKADFYGDILDDWTLQSTRNPNR